MAIGKTVDGEAVVVTGNFVGLTVVAMAGEMDGEIGVRVEGRFVGGSSVGSVETRNSKIAPPKATRMVDATTMPIVFNAIGMFSSSVNSHRCNARKAPLLALDDGDGPVVVLTSVKFCFSLLCFSSTN